MRNLTITRQKSFVASLGKMKVYIEDPDLGELEINGVPCRKLGTLKNGETAVFPISDTAAKVYVIADKLSRGFSNDYYPLPAGTEDVTISGKNRYNPGAGNPFRFDGITDEAVLRSRKKNGRKGVIILILAFILGIFIGLARNGVFDKVEPKEFTTADLRITLTDDFREASYEGFTQCYESKVVAVFILEEDFSLMPGLESYSVEDYAELVADANGLDINALAKEQGVYYLDYVAQGGDGEDHYYMVTLHKGPDAFWLVQFATPVSNTEKLQDQFLEWAGSVNFS